MCHIYAIGESIYDIIFKNGEPVAAKAGGSMLNTAVSCGRLGLPVYFISEYGLDQTGDIINDFLIGNAVNTSGVYRFADGKTAVSLAFLNEENDARYSFYKLYPEKRLAIDLPDFTEGDIVLFGAFYSLMPEVRTQLISFVEAARTSGALIVYDPNMRSPHKDEINSLRELVFENLSLADIVRGSDEDFNTIFGIETGTAAYGKVKEYGVNCLIYTRSNIGVELYTPLGNAMVKVVPVEVVSTIGAGDSFNAGLICELFRGGVTREKMPSLTLSDLEQIVKTAISFGSHVCMHYENYISEKFAEDFK